MIFYNPLKSVGVGFHCTNIPTSFRDFIIPSFADGQVNATRLTAVAMKEGIYGSEVEVRVNLPSCRWRNRLQIIVDNHEVLLNSSLNKWQWFTSKFLTTARNLDE